MAPRPMEPLFPDAVEAEFCQPLNYCAGPSMEMFTHQTDGIFLSAVLIIEGGRLFLFRIALLLGFRQG